MRIIKNYIHIIILGCFFIITDAPAHMALAHYRASPWDLRSTQNLPDLWLSRVFTWTSSSNFGWHVNSKFCWSHACRRYGDNSVLGSFELFGITFSGVTYPETPTAYGVPEGVQDPGKDMYYIWANKLLSENKTDIMKKTAQGFIGHNTADSYVHFDYYLGGTPSNWMVDHGMKEYWAEFEIFLQYGGYWDGQGNPVLSFSMDATGDAGIINLAQKVYRKNRQTVDNTLEPPQSITVESASSIYTKISNQNSELTNYINDKLDADMYYAYSLYEADESTDWNYVELLTIYSSTQSGVSAALASYP